MCILKAGGKYDFLVVDSIQTAFVSDHSSGPGSVAQVRLAAERLMTMAKQNHVTVILAGHVTKDGAIAGPRLLEHLVDVVLYFDTAEQSSGPATAEGGPAKVLRCYKNRFGATHEVGVFAMTRAGLVSLTVADANVGSDPVRSLSAGAISGQQPLQHWEEAPGLARTVAVVGTRGVLVELESLAIPHSNPTARSGGKASQSGGNVGRSAPPRPAQFRTTGFDQQRMVMLTAVLLRSLSESYPDVAGVLNGCDLFLNIPGGLRLLEAKQAEPSADLGICAAMLSAALGRPLPPNTIFLVRPQVCVLLLHWRLLIAAWCRFRVRSL